MAKVILGNNENYTVAGTNTSDIYGTGGAEQITIQAGATVTLDASFNLGGDTLVLPGNATAYTMQLSGTTVTFTNTSNGTTVEVPAGTAGADIQFSDGTRQLIIDTANSEVKVGDDVATSTPATLSAPVLAYDASGVSEAGANDGSISETITITLSNDTFVGTNGQALNNVTVNNVPTGLTAVVTKTSDTVATLSFTGNATSHADLDDIANLEVVFADAAFTNSDASAVTNATKSDLTVNFADPASTPVLAYDVSGVSEAGANDGSISETITITLSNDTFVGTNGQALNNVTVNNVPTGLTAVVTKTSDTVATLSFTGNATSHADLDDIANLEVVFADAAFTNSDASAVTNATKSDLTVNFADPASTPALAYDVSGVSEAGANDGSISETITITLSNDTFVGTNGQALNNVTVNNVPTGLTAVVTKTSDTVATLSFTGNATSHADLDDIANLEVVFADAAFTNSDASAVTNATKSDLTVNFADPASTPALAYDVSGVSEAGANDGSISETITITLSNDTFVGTNGQALNNVTVNNVPTGLTAVVTKTSDTVATLSFTGNATSHADLDDIANLEVVFADAAFTNSDASAVTNATKSDLTVNFADPASTPALAYDVSGVSEAGANDGSISETITITLSNDTFVGTNGQALNNVTVNNVPTGLTAVVTKTSDTVATLSFTGNATSHADLDDIANLEVVFADAAFTNSDASAVTNATKSDLTVNFADPASTPALAYDVSGVSEAGANDGSISETITITLSNDTFVGTNGQALNNVTVNNVPTGLTAVVTKTSDTVATLSFTGNATSHADLDDIANLEVVFADAAFTNSDASAVTNATKSDLTVNFADPASTPALAYDVSGVSEAGANDGSISETITITLSNDTFVGTNGQALNNVTVNNVPTGLTAVVTKTSDTVATLSFTGNATSHADLDDIANLEVVFADAAFTNSDASAVTNATKSDLTVNFADPASTPALAYDVSGVSEAGANDGSISETITITLSNDTFVGTNGQALNNVTVNNVPTGLTAVVTKTSDTVATLSFTGNATSHADLDDIANLEVVFADAAFTNSDASAVTNATKSDLTVNFADPASTPVLAYDVSGVSEAGANDGSISETITITLSNDTFVGTNGQALNNVTVNNVPTGLTAVVTKTSDTVATLSFTGNATSHADLDDIANLEVVFADAAFTNSDASAVTNATKSDLTVDFYSPVLDASSAGSFYTLDNTAVYNVADSYSAISGANASAMAQAGTVTISEDLATSNALSGATLTNIDAVDDTGDNAYGMSGTDYKAVFETGGLTAAADDTVTVTVANSDDLNATAATDVFNVSALTDGQSATLDGNTLAIGDQIDTGLTALVEAASLTTNGTLEYHLTDNTSDTTITVELTDDNSSTTTSTIVLTGIVLGDSNVSVSNGVITFDSLS